MTINEVKQALGSWSIRLRKSTPRAVLDSLTYFGHVAVLPNRLDPVQYGDNLLPAARYVGVFRSRDASDEYILNGSGMAFWLGDEDDKGDVYETPVTLTGASFAASVAALLPASGAIASGTINSIAGTYTGTHQYQTPRKAITYVADIFGGEWRVNGNGTLDAGTAAQLYVTTPKAILMRREAGRDLQRVSLPGSMQLDTKLDDYTTRVLLLAEGEGAQIATGSAELGVVPYKDIHGNDVKLTRIVSESDTGAGNANTRAQLVLNLFSSARRTVSLTTDTYDVKGDFVVGDIIDIWDPDSGFYDPAREVYWEGLPINPIALRCVELSWPVAAEWTVAFRDINGTWIDLSPYYVPESGQTTVTVGAFDSSLIDVGGDSVVGRGGQPDTSVPAAPAFTGFSTGAYQSATRHTTRAVIRAQWSTPLNLDASTITDGDHYEIRYRVNQTVGYEVAWDILAGYDNLFDEEFTNPIVDGWPAGWSTAGGVAGDYDVASGEGTHSLAATNSSRRTYRGSATDGQLYFDVKTDTVAAGAVMYAAGMLRSDGTDNMYMAQCRFNTDQTITAQIVKRVAGVETTIATAVVGGLTHAAGTWYRVGFQNVGTALRMRIWARDTQSEPGAWHAEGTDSALASAGAGGMRTIRLTGNTSGTTLFSFDNALMTDLGTVGGYTWDELGGWDTPISDPVQSSPEWITAFVGWGTNAFTITELTPGVIYEIQIRAVDSANPPNQGPWSASSFVTTLGDIVAPSTPAAPVVAASRIAIQVRHNLGKASGGTFNLEPDLDHLEVHVGGSDHFFPDETTKVGELVASTGMTLKGIPAIGTFQIEQTEAIWVRVVAVDRDGNKSAGSPAVQATAQLIDDTHISDLSVSKLTAGTITAVWVNAGRITTAETGRRTEMNSEGLKLYDELGAVTAVFGEIEPDDFGIALRNDAGELTRLSDLVFGPQVQFIGIGGERTSGSYGDLEEIAGSGTPPGFGPIVNVLVGETGRLMVVFGCMINWDINNASAGVTKVGGLASVELTGANSVAPHNIWSCGFMETFNIKSGGDNHARTSGTWKGGITHFFTGLDPGLTTVTMKYLGVTGSGSDAPIFQQCSLAAFPY